MATSDGGGTFREAYTVHLPSQTTLYSGAHVSTSLSDDQPAVCTSKNGQRRVRVVSRFATEQQSIEVAAISYRRPNSSRPTGSSGGMTDRVDFDSYEGRLPRGLHALQQSDQQADENDRLVCVAHSSLPMHHRKSSSAVQAYILRRISSPQDSGGHGAAATDTSRGGGAAAAESSTNTSSGTGGADGAEQRPNKQHRRHGSGSSIRIAESIDSVPIDGDVSSSKSIEKALLVVSGLTTNASSRGDEADQPPNAITATCEIPLNYLPLSLRVANIVQTDATESVGVFVGSVEDTRLRLYIPREEQVGGGIQQHVSAVLEEVPLSLLPTSKDTDDGDEGKNEEILNLSSPVMAIDFLNVNIDNESDSDGAGATSTFINYLALGCQDGAVRVASFFHEPSTFGGGHKFTAVGSSSLLVDGPIVTVDLSIRLPKYPTTNTQYPIIDLVVGSLCGFACTFHQQTVAGNAADQTPFQGPEEIVSNLWSGRLDAEDGVLCVKSIVCSGTCTGYAIAVGTYSGRVLVFEPILASKPSSSQGKKEEEIFESGADAHTCAAGYKLFWSSQLSYPIHGISSADLDGDGLAELLITTRRSLHIFREDIDDAVEAAKKRIMDFCR